MKMWYVLLLLAGAEPPSTPEPFSDDQIEQSIIPQLQGELDALELQLESKKKYFEGSGTFQSAFWEWSLAEVWPLSALEIEKTIRIAEHQQQNLPTVENESELQKKLFDIRYQIWQSETEIRALDIQVLSLLEKEYKDYEDLIIGLEELLKKNRQELSTLDVSVDQITVAQRAQERDLLEEIQWALLTSWTRSGSTEIDQLGARLIDQSDATFYELSRPIEDLLPLVSDEQIKTQLESRIEEIRNQEVLALEAEWKEIQQTWSDFVNGLTKVEVEYKLSELKSQQSVPSEPELVSQIHQYKIDVMVQYLSQLDGVETEKELQASKDKLAAAKRKEQEDLNSNQVQQDIVFFRELETELRSKEAERHHKVLETFNIFKKEYTDIQELTLQYNSLPPLDSGRGALLEEIVTKTFLIKQEIQSEIENLDDVYLNIQSASPQPGSKHSVRYEKMLDNMDNLEVIELIGDLSTAHLDEKENIKIEQMHLYKIWIQMNAHLAQFDVFQQFNEHHRWSDFPFEWNYPSLVLQVHTSKIRSWLGDINSLVNAFKTVVWWLMVLLVWRRLSNSITTWWWSFREWLEEKNHLLDMQLFVSGKILQRTKEQEQLIVPMFHFCTSLLLYFLNKDAWVGLIFTPLTIFTGWRLGEPLINHLVDLKEIRRSLVVGFRWLIVVFFGFAFIGQVMTDVLFTYQSSMLIHWIQRMVLSIVLLVQLGVWSTFLQSKAEQTVGLFWLKNWMMRWSEGFIGKRLRALVALVILGVDGLSRMMYWIIEHSSLVGSTLARTTLEEIQIEEGAQSLDVHWDLNIPEMLKPCEEQALSGIDQWIQERKRGCVVIVADEGMGKSVILRNVVAHYCTNRTDVDSVFRTHIFSVESVVRDSQWSVEALSQWMAGSLDLQDVQTKSDLVVQLNDLPPTIFGIDDVQRIFLRDVQGFSVLKSLFAIIQATSDRHCWLLTCHLSTWNFLNSPSTPIQTNFFRSIIEVPPWSVHDVQKHFSNIVLDHSMTLDFSSLTRLNSPQSLHRAETAFWRLLTDASKGNPTIALQLFDRALFKRSNSTGEDVFVRLFPLMKSEIIQELDDVSCFVLACIVLHNHLRFDELCRSLQMTKTVVQSTCRNLLALEIIHATDRGYEIHPIWFPWVEGVLVQKRFISVRG